jgi:hypothetical protein
MHERTNIDAQANGLAMKELLSGFVLQ